MKRRIDKLDLIELIFLFLFVKDTVTRMKQSNRLGENIHKRHIQ